MRRRALLAGWLLVLALAAILPLSLAFHGLIHLGPGSLTARRTLDRPVIALFGDVDIQHGSRAVVVDLGGSIRLRGTATDDLVSVLGSVYLDSHSRSEGDVLALPGPIYRARTSQTVGRLGGDLNAWNGHSVPAHPNAARLATTNVRLGLAAGLALLLVGICLTVVFPWQVVLIATTLRDAPVKSVAAGITNLLIFVFLVVPLGLSLAGLPFALLLAAAAFLAWLFGLTASAVILGRTLIRGTVPLISATCAGLLVIALGLSVPLVGPLLISGIGLAGTGALAVALVSRSRPVSPVS